VRRYPFFLRGGGLCLQPVFAHCSFGDFDNVFDVKMIHFIPAVLAHGFSVAQNFTRCNSDTLLTLAEHSVFFSHCILLRRLFCTLCSFTASIAKFMPAKAVRGIAGVRQIFLARTCVLFQNNVQFSHTSLRKGLALFFIWIYQEFGRCG